MSSALRASLVVIACLGWGESVIAGEELRLSIRDGRVWLTASNVTLTQVLDEWSRVGHTRVVNVDAVPGDRMTLLFEGMPEQRALELILRSASGYLASLRTEPGAGPSMFGQIVVRHRRTATSDSLAASTAISVAAVAAPAEGFEVAPGVTRLLTSDGRPVEDDQAESPPAGNEPPRQIPAGRPPRTPPRLP